MANRISLLTTISALIACCVPNLTHAQQPVTQPGAAAQVAPSANGPASDAAALYQRAAKQYTNAEFWPKNDADQQEQFREGLLKS